MVEPVASHGRRLALVSSCRRVVVLAPTITPFAIWHDLPMAADRAECRPAVARSIERVMLVNLARSVRASEPVRDLTEMICIDRRRL